VQASNETMSRFMALKPDYVTKRLCDDINKYLTEHGY
jgi:nucleoside diphosphate kinase